MGPVWWDQGGREEKSQRARGGGAEGVGGGVSGWGRREAGWRRREAGWGRREAGWRRREAGRQGCNTGDVTLPEYEAKDEETSQTHYANEAASLCVVNWTGRHPLTCQTQRPLIHTSQRPTD